ncbi:hypothetical protein WOLCODRAFT_69193 [Wolfiporia cocos MD-104 SS10]|uniref:Uncharacterized protein n=1 Tax=Wolfiporia cocos (strain MD-104) TaxID=742152 RepID=A0A2H3JT35_WOLCO|nr:hypothetical protein WOLCODRAFT_69193 [Wolfiporia cocos MD-104 SS10]
MSARRRPVCHTCGLPMVGHKRPNGSPVCPDKASATQPVLERRQPSPPSNFVSETKPSSGGHQRNPIHVLEPQPTEILDQSDDDNRSYASLVPTEPADDYPSDASEGIGDTGDGEKTWEDVEEGQTNSVSAVVSQSSVSASLTRSMSTLLRRSVPLASIFSTPTHDIPAISQAARRRGLTMGVLRAPPSPHAPGIKTEDEEIAHGSNLQRQNSWWVVMGRDTDAVAQLLDLHELGAEDQLVGLVGSYPMDDIVLRPTFLDNLIAAVIGGCIVVYGLSLL